MAERRMFAKSVIDSDAFLDMPMSTQILYFHLSMRADDDGFLNNAKKTMRMIGASEDDFKILILKQFIIPFPQSIYVIRHWLIHNYIQKDRYKETIYKSEKAALEINSGQPYQVNAGCIQDGYIMDTQVRLGKDRLDKSKTYIVEQSPTVHLCGSEVDGTSTSKPKTIEYPYKIVIDYLNIKAGTAYQDKSRDSRKHIKARFDEGYSVDDFKKVIDIKVGEWASDPDMAKYLRPSTLFGAKFEGYLNQKPVKAAKSKSKNDFHNFDQRDTDYDSVVLSRLQEKLKNEGGK